MNKRQAWNSLHPDMQAAIRTLLTNPMLQNGSKPAGIAIWIGGKCVYKQDCDVNPLGTEPAPERVMPMMLRRQAL